MGVPSSSSSPTQHNLYPIASNMLLVQTWWPGLNSLEAHRARTGVGKLPVKHQIVNISSFTGRSIISVATTQLRPCGSRAAPDST